jgi:single-strand DNA-binding protein
MSVNKTILVGNIGADPESRDTKSGTAVCNLRVATNERVKKNDEWQDHTEWHRVVCFGKTAENCAKYLQKGRQVYIEGKLRTTSYEKDGVTKYSTEIVADQVVFLGGGRGSDGESRSDYNKPADDINF